MDVSCRKREAWGDPVYWGVHTGNHRATVRPAAKLEGRL
jgi:hypothetical protein